MNKKNALEIQALHKSQECYCVVSFEALDIYSFYDLN